MSLHFFGIVIARDLFDYWSIQVSWLISFFNDQTEAVIVSNYEAILFLNFFSHISSSVPRYEIENTTNELIIVLLYYTCIIFML